MYIWKLERTEHIDYDEAAGFVVVAETEAEARAYAADYGYSDEPASEWLQVAKATRLGRASKNVVAGVILRDFRAG